MSVAPGFPVDSEYKASSSAIGRPYYSRDEEAAVEQGKRTHAETTKAAARAARLALETRETAANSLEGLQKQGEQLSKINRDMDLIAEDHKEAKSTVKDLNCMRNWCCCLMIFSCCCDCTPHQERDATRKMRVQERKTRLAANKVADVEIQRMEHGPGAAEQELDPAEKAERQRAELLSKRTAGERAGTQNGPTGQGLADEDRDFVQRQTQEQNANLDVVGDAVADFKRMAYSMNEEVNRQNGDIEQADGKLTDAKADVRKVARDVSRYNARR